MASTPTALDQGAERRGLRAGPPPGEVGGEDLEGAVVGQERGQGDGAVGEHPDRAVRLGGEDGEDRLGEDVVVVPVAVERVAVGASSTEARLLVPGWLAWWVLAATSPWRWRRRGRWPGRQWRRP